MLTHFDLSTYIYSNFLNSKNVPWQFATAKFSRGSLDPISRARTSLYKNISFTDIPLESSFRIDPNWPKIRKNGNDVTICQDGVIINFFDVILFLLLNLVIGPSCMSILFLVLEL